MGKQLIFTVILLYALNLNAQTGVYVPQLKAFDGAMQSLMDQYDIPGAQLAITYQGRLVYNRGFGQANVEKNELVYPTSKFRIASVSKTLTGVACIKLMEKGLLNLDAKVFGPGGILKDIINKPILDSRVQNITVRMLLHHSGGWDRDISGDPMFNAYQIAKTMGVSSPSSEETVINYVLSQKKLDFSPGTNYKYSNFGYCILGRVIEKVTGSSYEKYINDNILIPLGMINTQLGFNLKSKQLANEVTYYDFPGASLAYSIYDNITRVPWPYGGFNLEFMDSHGGWVSSCEDLLKFVCAFDRFDTRPDFLSKSSIDILVKSSTYNPNYACGISVNSNNNWWHLGSLPGTTSEIVRNGNRQLNWAILLNTRDANVNINAAVDNLVWNVLPSITSWPSNDLFSTISSTQDSGGMNSKIDVYPNPTENHLNFTVQANAQLISTTGHTMLNENKVSYLDITNIPSGLYFLILTNDQRHILHKSKIVKL